MRIVLHIDEVVLSGFDRVDAAAVSAALKAELTSQLGGEGDLSALTTHGNVASVRAGRVRIPREAGGGAIGRAVAASIIQPRANR
jgi:hypothetical protein